MLYLQYSGTWVPEYWRRKKPIGFKIVESKAEDAKTPIGLKIVGSERRKREDSLRL